jgi:hypothetical protein
MSRAVCFVLGLSVSLLSSSARAQEALPEAARELPRWPWIPAGATTDRVGTEPLAVGAAVTNSFYRRNHRDYGLRLELYGQYTFDPAEELGMGVFVSMPVNVQGADGDFYGVPGSLDVRIIVEPHAIPAIPVILTAGVAFGFDYLDDIGRAYGLALAAGRGRTTDLAAQLPSSTWLRVAATLLYRKDRFVARLDLGTDGRVAKSDNYRIGPEELRAENFLRANGAAGFIAGPVAVMAEGVIVWERYELGLISPTLALTVTGRHGMFEPFASAVVPVLGSVSRDIPVMVMAGVRVAPPLPWSNAPE